MSTPSLSIPYLRVQLAEGTVMTYTNPKPWACLKFSTCSYWHRTRSLYWKNLSIKQYAIFYLSDKCLTDNESFFVPDISNPAGGDYTSKTSVLFRSMSVGVVKDKATFTYVDNCPNDKENAVVNDTSVYLTWGSDDGPIGGGGLSSNWNDELR